MSWRATSRRSPTSTSRRLVPDFVGRGAARGVDDRRCRKPPACAPNAARSRPPSTSPGRSPGPARFRCRLRRDAARASHRRLRRDRRAARRRRRAGERRGGGHGGGAAAQPPKRAFPDDGVRGLNLQACAAPALRRSRHSSLAPPTRAWRRSRRCPRPACDPGNWRARRRSARGRARPRDRAEVEGHHGRPAGRGRRDRGKVELRARYARASTRARQPGTAANAASRVRRTAPSASASTMADPS